MDNEEEVANIAPPHNIPPTKISSINSNKEIINDAGKSGKNPSNSPVLLPQPSKDVCGVNNSPVTGPKPGREKRRMKQLTLDLRVLTDAGRWVSQISRTSQSIEHQNSQQILSQNEKAECEFPARKNWSHPAKGRRLLQKYSRSTRIRVCRNGPDPHHTEKKY